MLDEETGDYAAAVQKVAQSLAILSELGSPDAQPVAGTLTQLREEMGEEAFGQALVAAGFSFGE